jgi:hypothetical protein
MTTKTQTRPSTIVRPLRRCHSAGGRTLTSKLIANSTTSATSNLKVLDLLKDIFIREQKKSQLLEHDRGIFNLEYKLLQGEKTKIVNPLLAPLKCLRLNIEPNIKEILEDIVVQAEPEPLPIKDRRFKS